MGYTGSEEVGGGTKDRGLSPILGSFQPQEEGHWRQGIGENLGAESLGSSPDSAVKAWPSFLTSLGLSFLIRKMGCS